MADAFDLQRFTDAQEAFYDDVLDELHDGRKTSHWMWFVFPQLRELGRSATALKFGIASLQEARAYLQHPLLGPRLRECTNLMLRIEGRSIHAILGTPDDLKFRSCMTLFARAAPEETIFAAALRKYFNGIPDARTLEICCDHSLCLARATTTRSTRPARNTWKKTNRSSSRCAAIEILMKKIDQFPDDENGDVLRRMQDSGDDLSRPRDIDFTVVLPSESTARSFSRHFVAAGYEVKVENAGTVPELPWDVVVVKNMRPEHAAITAFEEELQSTAEPLGGRNDGWGCFEQSDSLH